MPSFSSQSSIRVASQDHALRLKITHHLVQGSPSDVVRSVKGRLPKELDVLWLSDLIISFSGSLDGQQIPAHDISRSGLVHHLQTQLTANADRLGLNNVSRSFVDDADGLPKLTLTPSRPFPHASRPHANLVSLHLAYTWRTVRTHTNGVDSDCLIDQVHPFSPTLFLPAEVLLNRVTEQFLIYHLVGRYPLIFGPWCKRLDLEMQYFSSIAGSIIEIMTRSQNSQFSLKCKRLLKIARRHHKHVLQTCAAALPSCADERSFENSDNEINNLHAMPILTDEQVVCESMEQLFRVGVPQRRFKPSGTPHFMSLPQDDDSLLPCTPDEGIDDEASWVALHETATSLPFGLVADSFETSPEDMDVFSKGEWPGDGAWCYGADTGSGEREMDAHSDESLIGATSFPLARITTRSPQPCSLALYHHLNVDRHELDSAANGLRYEDSQLAYLGCSENSASFNLTRLPSHALQDHPHSEKYEQVMPESETCQVDSEGFESLDSCIEDDVDSDSIWLNLDEDDVDAPRQRQRPNGADLDADLEWNVI